jgi:outer membrane immunogenic protein
MAHYRVSAAAILLISASAANAADIPVPDVMPIEAPVVDVRDWSGFYIGAHVGYGWADFEFEDPSVSITGLGGLGVPGLSFAVPLEREFEADGVLGGAQAGVDVQFGSVVAGVLGDISWTDISGEFRSTADLGLGFTTAEGVSAELDWLGTGRGRLGWAFDRFLIYATGGVAFGEVQSAGDITLFGRVPGTLGPVPLGTLTASGEETHVGWTAGAGVEGMLTEHLSAKLEYLYADLGSARHEGPAEISVTPAGAALLAGTGSALPAGLSLEGEGEFDIDIQTVKLGLSYRF